MILTLLRYLQYVFTMCIYNVFLSFRIFSKIAHFYQTF